MKAKHLTTLDRLSIGLSPYILVRMKGKEFLRKRRGLDKPVPLNAAFAQNAELLKICAPASKRIRMALNYYLKDLETGYLGSSLAAAIRRGYKKEGTLDIKWIKDQEMQKSFPLGRLYRSNIITRITDSLIKLELAVHKGCISPPYKAAVSFFYEAILLYGDCSEDNKLRVEETRSETWTFEETKNLDRPIPVVLELIKPPDGVPWVLFLKVSCNIDDPSSGTPSRYFVNGNAISSKHPHLLNPFLFSAQILHKHQCHQNTC